jgi:hypothetical protein
VLSIHIPRESTIKSLIKFRLHLATAGLAAALVAGGCSMLEPKAERYVAPPVGSTWTLAQRNTGSYGSGTAQVPFKRVERMWQGKLTEANESPQQVILTASGGGWAVILSPDGKPIISYDPPLDYDWPLVVGKTWTKSYRMTVIAKNQVIPFDATYKVEAYEDVTVPAGTFKAFKISSSTNTGSEDTYWFTPELGLFVKQSLRRTDKSGYGPGTREVELVSQSIKK